MKKVKINPRPNKKKPISEKIKAIKVSKGIIKLNDMIIISCKDDFQ